MLLFTNDFVFIVVQMIPKIIMVLNYEKTSQPFRCLYQ